MAKKFNNDEFIKNLRSARISSNDDLGNAVGVNLNASEQKERMKSGEKVYKSNNPIRRFLDNLFGTKEVMSYSADHVRDNLDLDNFVALDRSGKKYEDFGSFNVTFYKTKKDKDGNEYSYDKHTLLAFTPKEESANSDAYDKDNFVDNVDGTHGLKSKVYGGFDYDTSEEMDGSSFINTLKKYKDAGYDFVINGEPDTDDSGKVTKTYYKNSSTNDANESVPTGSLKVTESSTNPNLLNFGSSNYNMQLNRENQKLNKTFIENLRKNYGNKYNS